MQGLDALDITWDEGPNVAIGSAEVWDALRNASKGGGVVAKEQGDVKAAFAAYDRYEAVYELPFLAHATMEPLNCTVHFTKDACEVWTGTQVIARVQSEVAKALGLPTEKVTVHNFLIGGGFGRRLEPDMAVKAALIAQHVEGPVKVIWRREEDMQHDVYRPVYHDALAASVKDGKVTGWTQRITGAAIIARWLPPAFQKGIDIDAVDGATDNPYGVPNVRVEYVRAEALTVPTGFWRGVGPNNNFFASESFIDELAHRVARTPSRIGSTCSTLRRASRLPFSWLRRSPAGVVHFLRAPREASPLKRRSVASLRPFARRKSMRTAKFACAGSFRLSIPVSLSIPTPSSLSSKADSFSV